MLHILFEIAVAILCVYGGYTLLHDIIDILDNTVRKKTRKETGDNGRSKLNGNKKSDRQQSNDNTSGDC